MTSGRRFAFSLLGGIVGAAAMVAPVLAVSTSPDPSSTIRLGLYPAGQRSGYVQLSLAAGENAAIPVDILSAGRPLQVETYAADAYTLVNGGFGARFEPDPETGPTGWLTYPSETIALAGDQVATRSASVSVPPGTMPGEYITALVVENGTPVPIGSGGLRQVVRAALAVVIEVPGPRRAAMTVGGAEHVAAAGTSIIGFPVQNGGNVRLKPTASFRLETEAGSVVAAQDAGLDSFYAGLPARVEFPLAQALGPGRYCARLVLTTDGTGAVDSGHHCFDVTGSIPEPLLNTPTAAEPERIATEPLVGGAVLLILVGSLWLLILVRRRRRRQDSTTR